MDFHDEPGTWSRTFVVFLFIYFYFCTWFWATTQKIVGQIRGLFSFGGTLAWVTSPSWPPPKPTAGSASDRLCSNLVCGLEVTKCVLSTSHGWGGASLHVRTCTPSPYLRIRVANCAKIWCVARDPKVTRFTRVGGGVTTLARACPVSLSRKPLSPGIEATPKTDLSLSRSLVHRQTWRLTGN